MKEGNLKVSGLDSVSHRKDLPIWSVFRLPCQSAMRWSMRILHRMPLVGPIQYLVAYCSLSRIFNEGGVERRVASQAGIGTK